MRRLTNNSTYEVITNRGRYAVTLEHLKNTTAGCPRFKANLIIIEVFGEKHYTGSFYTATFTFKGHYMNDLGEAKDLVEKFENDPKNGIYYEA